ncbi:MAG: ABC transporter permease [Lachnospiraceae bacterium]|nr:ABC transporter permease [Lachnospiraceae bacterium]
MEQILTLLQSAVVFGTVIMFGCVGETISEKGGNLNLGVPGIMYLGGIASLAGAYGYENGVSNPNGIVALIIAFICAFAASVLGGLIYSFLTITLRANQNVTGLTLTIFGSGVANFFGGSLNKMAGGVGQISVPVTSGMYRTGIPGISGIGFMVYVSIAVAIAAHIFLSRTRKGLNLRAVGENPATADAAGINITRYKYFATCIGAGISGMGGLYYVMDYIKGTWANDGSIENLGWLAVALVIFTMWKPVNAIWGAYVFGVLYWLYYYVPGLGRSSQELFKMIPYVVTIIVLVVVSLRKKKENQAPQSLGLPYFREQR